MHKVLDACIILHLKLMELFKVTLYIQLYIQLFAIDNIGRESCNFLDEVTLKIKLLKVRWSYLE